MKRIVLALSVGLSASLYASAPVVADDVKPVAPAPTVVTTGTTTVLSTTPATRTGLFSRLRARRSNSTMMTMPVQAGTIVTPMPSTTIPTPMPKPTTVTPAGGTMMSMPLTTTAGYTVMSTPARTGLFGRLRNRNTMTTVPMTMAPMPAPMPVPMSGVVPASGTVAMAPMTSSGAPMMMTSTTTTRMGLLARMRARRS